MNMTLPRTPLLCSWALLGSLLLICVPALSQEEPQEEPPESPPAQEPAPQEPAGEQPGAQNSAAQDSAAQEPAQPAPADEDPQAVFVDDISVKVVNVEVFVRDKQGNPITGLTADDFEVFENKRTVPITNFYEVDKGERVGVERAKPEEDPLRKPGVTNLPDLRRSAIEAVPADERLSLVIYVDHFNIRPFNRNRVFRYLREFLRERIDRQDRVMLVSYNRSVKVERNFTSDPQLISNALYDLEKHTGGRTTYDSDRRDLLMDLEKSNEGGGAIYSRIRVYAESIRNDLQFTLDGLNEMIGLMGGLPGRKAFLYVSDGLPMRPGEEMFHAVDEQERGSGEQVLGASNAVMDSFQYDASRLFMTLTNAANANGVTFYTIDAAGLRTSSLRGAEMRSSNFSSQIDSITTNNMQSTIMLMADDTGGQYLVNTNNFGDGLNRMADDFDHYYSLGFAPAHSGSGRAYNLEVKLKNKGGRWKIRHRENYRDKPVETEMADATTASLNFGFQANEMGLELQARNVIQKDDGNFMVHMDLRIPIGEVVLVPGRDGHVARLRMWVQARDDKGDISPVAQAPISFLVAEEDLEVASQQVWVYQVPLLMKGGDHRISIGIRDDLGGRTSFINRSIRLGS